MAPGQSWLETGRNDVYRVATKQLDEVTELYLDVNYSLEEMGQFFFDYDGDCLWDRHYRILTI
jgi:hypothetical protein